MIVRRLVTRRRVAFLVLLAIVVTSATLFGIRLSRFIAIFAGHPGFSLSQPDIQKVHSVGIDTRRVVVPNITHQIFHNWTDPAETTIPSDWEEIRQTIIDHNPNYEHKLWLEAESRKFIEDEYPWFLDTYDGLPHPVQRVDVLRYFLIRHFGGIYMDLDNGVQDSLDSVRYFPAWTTDPGHGALNIGILGGEAQHPFFVKLTDNIIPYAHNYLLPYVTINLATGQWFFTRLWNRYHEDKPRYRRPLTMIRMDYREGASPVTIFTSGRGETWQSWDNAVFAWIAAHVLLTVLYFVAMMAAVAVIVGVFYLVAKCIGRARATGGYQRIDRAKERPDPEVAETSILAGVGP